MNAGPHIRRLQDPSKAILFREVPTAPDLRRALLANPTASDCYLGAEWDRGDVVLLGVVPSDVALLEARFEEALGVDLRTLIRPKPILVELDVDGQRVVMGHVSLVRRPNRNRTSDALLAGAAAFLGGVALDVLVHHL